MAQLGLGSDQVECSTLHALRQMSFLECSSYRLDSHNYVSDSDILRSFGPLQRSTLGFFSVEIGKVVAEVVAFRYFRISPLEMHTVKSVVCQPSFQPQTLWAGM